MRLVPLEDAGGVEHGRQKCCRDLKRNRCCSENSGAATQSLYLYFVISVSGLKLEWAWPNPEGFFPSQVVVA